MFRKGKRGNKQSEFYKNRHFSRSLNDLYGHNILNVIEPEKDENYWNFGVSKTVACVIYLPNSLLFSLTIKFYCLLGLFVDRKLNDLLHK